MNRQITREGKMLRKARLKLGFSQQQVATMVGMQVRQYQRLEYGESDFRRIGIRAGLVLCAVLHLNPVELVFADNPGLLEEMRNRPVIGRMRKRRTE